MQLPWTRARNALALTSGEQARSFVGPDYNLGDPALAEFLGMAGRNDAGVEVTELTTLGFSAYWRAVEVVAGTIGTLPLKTYRDTDVLRPDGTPERQKVTSFLDSPGGTFFSPFQWKHLVITHLMLHGNAYLLHLYNAAGAIIGLFPIQPRLVHVRYGQLKDAAGNPVGPDQRLYEISVSGAADVIYTEDDLTHVMGLSVDGIVGLSPINVMRNAIGTGIAGDKAAARMFSSGMLLGGIVTSNESLTTEQADEIKSGMKAKMSGTNNAGDIAVINASLTFSPWSMDAESAQFIQARVHQVEEVSRMTGVPPHLLGQTEKQTSWGQGVEEQNRGLARYTLARWTTALEEKLSQLLPQPRFCEFDFAGLLQAAPEVEIPLLIQQIEAGILTVNEARAIRNLPPTSTPAPVLEPILGPVPIKPDPKAE
jgi:HK97 family phage portal protein